jgi:hypothetical protein
MRFDGWKLGCNEWWVVRGIYSPNHQSDHWWGLLSHGAPDSPVRQPRHQVIGLRPLELLTGGPPDSPMRLLALLWLLRAQAHTVHFYCSVADDHWRCVAITPLAHRTVWWYIGQSGGTSDSSVNYSGAAPRIPEGGKFGVGFLGAPDSPVRQNRAAFGCFAPFFLNPFFELCIGLLWTFGTCKTYNLEQTS